MVQYSTKMIFAVLDVSLIMGLNIGETVFKIINNQYKWKVKYKQSGTFFFMVHGVEWSMVGELQLHCSSCYVNQ